MEPYDVENTKRAVESTMYERANWKLVLENNRECYHCAGNHRQDGYHNGNTGFQLDEKTH